MPGATVPLLELRGFGIAFGGRPILDAVDLSLPVGPGCTVLLGPSGTGKSTLLRTLAGYNTPNPGLATWGEALYLGDVCTATNRPALVMQNSKLLISDLWENLACALPNRGELTRAMQTQYLAALLDELGQAHLLDSLGRKVIELPLTVQRAIAILRQVVADPALLMVDEPTAGLLPEEAAPLLALIATLAARRPMLVVLHNLMEAQRLADGIVLLASGQVQEVGPAEAYFAGPQSESGRRFLATGSCPEASPAAAPAAESPAVTPATATAAPAPISASRGPRGFLWLIPDRLAGTPYPGIVLDTAADLAALREVGVTRLISLTEEAFDPELAARYGMHSRPCPMPDMHPPTLAQAAELCVDIDAFLAAGEVVAVHCRAGLGRTGTVLAAYHLWQGQGRLSALQALEDVRRIEPLWVQSQAQVDFLESFAEALSERFSHHAPAAIADL